MVNLNNILPSKFNLLIVILVLFIVDLLIIDYRLHKSSIVKQDSIRLDNNINVVEINIDESQLDNIIKWAVNDDRLSEHAIDYTIELKNIIISLIERTKNYSFECNLREYLSILERNIENNNKYVDDINNRLIKLDLPIIDNYEDIQLDFQWTGVTDIFIEESKKYALLRNKRVITNQVDNKTSYYVAYIYLNRNISYNNLIEISHKIPSHKRYLIAINGSKYDDLKLFESHMLLKYDIDQIAESSILVNYHEDNDKEDYYIIENTTTKMNFNMLIDNIKTNYPNRHRIILTIPKDIKINKLINIEYLLMSNDFSWYLRINDSNK